MILIYGILLSVIVGYIRTGRLKNYANAPLSLIFLPILAFLLEALAAHLPERYLAPIVFLEYALLMVFVFANRRYSSIWVIGAGSLLNACAIFSNGFRMPVTPVVYLPAFENFYQRIQAGEFPHYTLVDWDAPFWFLGDTIAITKVVPGIASIGDFVLALGMFLLIQQIMLPSKKQKPSDIS